MECQSLTSIDWIHYHHHPSPVPNPWVDVSHHIRADMPYAGSRLNITCAITLDSVLSPVLGNLRVTSKWTKQGEKLLSANGDSRISVSNVSQQDSTTSYSSTLMFSTLRTSDAGNYTCEVTVTPLLSPVRNVMNGTNSSTATIKAQGKKGFHLVNSHEITVYSISFWFQTIYKHIKS